MIQFDDNGAASPDSLGQQTYDDPFGSVAAAGQQQAGAPSSPPPPPQQGSEDDVSDFSEHDLLARLFSGEEIAAPATRGAPDPPSSTQMDKAVQPQGTSATAQQAAGEPGKDGAPQTVTPEDLELLSKAKNENIQRRLEVLSAFESDPVNFVRKYAPEIEQSIAARMFAERSTPVDYANAYADQALAEKYGEDFEYNPADLAIRNSPSAQYFADRQVAFQQGLAEFNQQTEQRKSEAAQQQRIVEQTAQQVLVRHGVPVEKYSEVIRIAESLPASPETYYDMLFTYLIAKGKVRPEQSRQTQTTHTHQPSSRLGVNLPPPTNGVPGTSAQRQPLSNEEKELLDMFAVEML